MKALALLRARPKTLASAAGVTAAAVALATLAFTYEGNPTAEVDLNDGGVWITKSSDLLVGHFNNESTVIDGGLHTAGENFDILQHESHVVVVDREESTITAVDPSRVTLGDSAPLPGGAVVELGGQTTAVLEPKSGALWVVPVPALSQFEPAATEPVAELGADADVTVGSDGTVYAVSAEESSVYTITVDPQGEAEDVSTAEIELPERSVPSITVVGTKPVVLDTVSGVITAPDGFRSELGAVDGAVLQQISADSDSVVVATPSALVRVPFDGSEHETVNAGSEGVPAAPVQLLGCTYGAWAGSDAFARDCVGDGDDLIEQIPGIAAEADLVFRVNRDVIVLNDVFGGAAWIATESLQQVDNWQDITPPEGDENEDEKTSEETVETSLPERSEKNADPVAVDDENLGVRPGSTTLLPVLDNDTDADGDVLVATVLGDGPAIGEVQPINNGSALQIAVPEGATGAGTFRYAIEDGRGGEDDATVSFSVHDWSVNGAPKPKRTTTLTVEAGGTVSYNVLPDWIDPDGDDIYLKNVVAAPGDEVDFSTDGQITYRAVASLEGRKEINITVADGLGETASGTLVLDVRPAGSTDPRTNADHVVTRVGQQVTVSPLANDSSSGREQLRLSRVDEVADAAIVPDYPNKSFTFTSARAGVYYVQYLVAAGSRSAPGLVRVDVLEDVDEQAPPVAVRDVALLPAGGEVLVGVLHNDTDPAGGVLVVQSVTVEPGSGISVSVLNHETLRVGDQGTLDEQVRISYRISNGTRSADGEVVVIPIEAPERLLPPVANDDRAVVRAGDVVTIPVLDNDSHPNGDTLTLKPELLDPVIDPADGEIFVSQNDLRFKAGDEAKTVYATYEVVDSAGQTAAGYVQIQILAVDEENNAAPRPRDITVRALSGSKINIPVPLDGIDVDGDSVELLDPASAPGKGRIVEVAQDYYVYEAFDDAAGVDTFSYRVRDRLGKEGTATIRVGIAPGEELNQAPYAVRDTAYVRPGREIAVPVMLNDSDPEGDRIFLVSDGLEVQDIPGLSARVSGERVLVQAPDEPTEASVQYTIRDERGAEATAALQVTVAEDVPLLFPIARDDRVLSSEVTEEYSVDVDVLANDEDPDGTTDSLELAVAEDSGATVLENRQLRVTVGQERQLIRYTITDQDGQEASAFLFVPALEQLRPTLSITEPVEVLSGETKVLPLAEYVTVAGGGDVVITETENVSASNANGAGLVQDERTLVYTSAEGYHGPDGLVFEVTDGTGPDDPAGRKATLTIPINVLPPENQQPVFTRGQLDVAPGEAASSIDLQALVTDPDPDDAPHDFQITGSLPAGMSARLEGSRLLVEAPSNAPKGTTATLGLRVSDGETDPVDGTVEVRVTASTRPMPTANTDTVPEAHQGVAVTVPVLRNDYNPFPETPLSLVSVNTVTGRGAPEIVGDEVRVTPADDFVGTMIVNYRIMDATEDQDRSAEGQIELTVQGRPDAPGTPVVSSVQDRTVVLSWSSPVNNGAEITGYTVRAVQGGSYEKHCESTTCTLDGLTNNVKYVFQVTATNRVGESDPSASSEEARPDARPDTPAPPTLKFGDRSLAVAWKTPTTPGSPVQSYTLEISPAPPSGIARKTGATGTSLVWEGLENGTEYMVRVQAHNLAPDPSTFSGWSTGEIPAGKPDAAGAPTTAEMEKVGNRAQMRVSWKAPSNNGDALDGYQLRVHHGSTVIRTIDVPAGQTSQAVTVDTSTTAYTYTVRAQNKAGWGDWSSASAPRRGVIAPDAPSAPKLTPGDRTIAVSDSYRLAAAQLNGASASEVSYQISVNNGGWQTGWNGTGITGVVNGTSYSIRVRAVSTVDGTPYASAASPVSNSVVPYGIPPKPSASAKNNGTSVTFSWSANGDNGSKITKTEINVNGGGWKSTSASSTTVGNGYSQSHSIQVRVTNAAGTSAVASASAKTSAPPQPDVWVTKGSYGSSCNNGPCLKFVVNWKNLNIGTHQVYCHASYMSAPISSNSYAVNFNGTGSQELPCWQGQDGIDVWVDIVGWGGSVDTRKTYWSRP